MKIFSLEVFDALKTVDVPTVSATANTSVKCITNALAVLCCLTVDGAFVSSPYPSSFTLTRFKACAGCVRCERKIRAVPPADAHSAINDAPVGVEISVVAGAMCGIDIGVGRVRECATIHTGNAHAFRWYIYHPVEASAESSIIVAAGVSHLRTVHKALGGLIVPHISRIALANRRIYVDACGIG